MSSKIKVDNIADQGNNNMLVKCGSTLTIGATGNTITLASGASQTGFGRTGTVDWQTDSIKTSNFDAVNGQGFFVNTGGGSEITVTLPSSPSAGNIVAIADYGGTAATTNIVINRNGSNFEGGTTNGVINTNRETVTLVYVDGTQGWVAVNSNSVTSFIQAQFVSASGGNTTATCGDYKIHTFTGPGTFTVCNAGNPSGSSTVDYLVVAGGAGGGDLYYAGGGGAGGFRLSNSTCMSPGLTSPLASPTGLPVSAQAYPITVGAGGALNPGAAGSDGGVSTFSTITSAGGGGGTNGCGPNGNNGGSGGGGGGTFNGGTGNTPPTNPAQGTDGGNGGTSPQGPEGNSGGGGGGAATAGADSTNGAPQSGNSGTAGDGGSGSYVVSAGFAACNGDTGPVSNTRYFSGGGGGGSNSSGGPNGAGGDGGGGRGAPSSQAGTANTGGGGGGGSHAGNPPSGGSAGGSGIVIIRYKYQ